MRFNYRVIQLNRLDWRDFVQRPNPVAAALMSRMSIARRDRPRVKAECLAMLLGLKLNDEEREDLAWEIVDAYLPLDDAEEKTFWRELATITPVEEEKPMDEFITRRERGRSEGLLLGRIEGRAESARSVTLKLLQRRLGVISEMLVQRLSALSPEQLEDLSLASLVFVSVADLDAWLERHAPDDAPTH